MDAALLKVGEIHAFCGTTAEAPDAEDWRLELLLFQGAIICQKGWSNAAHLAGAAWHNMVQI
jgi:hypothetical protein